MSEDIFPLELFDNIRKHPENYKLLQRIPLTISGVDKYFPLKLEEPVEGEKVFQVVVLDTETTGMSKDSDKIIELGMVKATFSYARKVILSIDRFYDSFEDPGKPIPMEVQQLTHITDDMVAGHHINDDEVASFLAGRPLIVAHNASFDRPFFDKRFPTLKDLSWACSLQDIPWFKYGYNGTKLEYLNLVNGWFYEAHRAYEDCLALLWLLHVRADAFKDLVENALKTSYKLIVRGNTFNVNQDLKKLGFRFESIGQDKHWYCIESTLDKAQQKQQNLELLLKRGNVNFEVEIKELDAKTRYKLR